MDLAEVRACLQKDGFPIDVVSDVTIRSYFRSGERIFPLFIHLEPEYVTFAVIPFVKLPRTEEDSLLIERLLRFNRDMNMAKFSVDEDGDVVLCVEYRVEDLDPSEVRDAVDVLSFYTDKYRAELLAGGTSGS
jgi:hypothetical protein